MFIELTRTDGLPVWLNAAFIVTVEPSRNGGSIVVPIGDGLDYEVKEPPEAVLALLADAPPAKVVPVRPPKALTPRPDDVSPDCGIGDVDPVEGSVPEESGPAKESPAAAPKKPRRSRAAKKTAPSRAPAVLPPEGFDGILADMKTRKCRTARRLRNAIKNVFGKTDDAEIDRLIEAMINGGHIMIDGNGHVTWPE